MAQIFSSQSASKNMATTITKGLVIAKPDGTAHVVLIATADNGKYRNFPTDLPADSVITSEDDALAQAQEFLKDEINAWVRINDTPPVAVTPPSWVGQTSGVTVLGTSDGQSVTASQGLSAALSRANPPVKVQ